MKNSVKQSIAIVIAFIVYLAIAFVGLFLSGKFLEWGVDKAIEKWPADDDEDPEPVEGAENPEPGQEKNNEEEEKK